VALHTRILEYDSLEQYVMILNTRAKLIKTWFSMPIVKHNGLEAHSEQVNLLQAVHCQVSPKLSRVVSVMRDVQVGHAVWCEHDSVKLVFI
jgi:hypothetical protein